MNRVATILAAGVFSITGVTELCAQPANDATQTGERLTNGIVLPAEWPPRTQDKNWDAPVWTDLDPMPVPYLQAPPAVIPIDVGRQLFVDDFLIADSTLVRRFHSPEKYSGNPVLRPETELELNGGDGPVACPFNDAVLYDSATRQFRMWYHAGWFDGTALAVSDDGLHWQRPELDVVPGTNRVLNLPPKLKRDHVSVVIDPVTTDANERYKMFFYGRPGAGQLLSSPDGMHWMQRGKTGPLSDASSVFYNPFRRKWVYSIRQSRNKPLTDRGRMYWETDNFFDADFKASDRVFWCAADRLDLPDPKIANRPQLYDLNVSAYESLFIGLFGIHQGPHNDICLEGRFPKITQILVGYSRDGFHWHRPVREPFIAATKKPGDWDRGYVHPAGGGCVIVGDKLYFYYAAFSGKSPRGGAMYAGGATGVAMLRRDGFASMSAEKDPGTLTTRPVTFNGRHLFVNAQAAGGELRVEVLDDAGRPIEPYTLANCRQLRGDSTKSLIEWNSDGDLASLAGRPVRLRFSLTKGELYSFWVTPDAAGASNGYVAGGGPAYRDFIDAPASMQSEK